MRGGWSSKIFFDNFLNFGAGDFAAGYLHGGRPDQSPLLWSWHRDHHADRRYVICNETTLARRLIGIKWIYSKDVVQRDLESYRGVCECKDGNVRQISLISDIPLKMTPRMIPQQSHNKRKPLYNTSRGEENWSKLSNNFVTKNVLQYKEAQF